jgi:hypothetical protein
MPVANSAMPPQIDQSETVEYLADSIALLLLSEHLSFEPIPGNFGFSTLC